MQGSHFSSKSRHQLVCEIPHDYLVVIGRKSDFSSFFWKKPLRCAWVQNEFTWKIFDESIIKGHASKIAIPAIWFSYNYKNGPTGQFYRFCHIKFEYSRSMCVDKILFFFQNILELSYTAQKTTFGTTSKLFFKKKFLTLHPIMHTVRVQISSHSMHTVRETY